VVKVFKREGISAAGEATMPEFMGILKEPDIQYLKGNLIIQEAAAALDKEN
jgi:hypothetical protein